MSDIAAAIICVPFGPEHFEGAMSLSHQVGWPHKREDWQLIVALSKGIAALFDGRVVGTAFITPFGSSICSCNLIIVDEAMRGSGLGRRLTDAIMAMTGLCEYRLVATKAGLPLYKKLGFQTTGQVSQHQGIVADTKTENIVQWVDRPDRDVLTALDRIAFGGDRGALIDALLEVGRVSAIEGANGIEGFAVLRSFGRGELIGPVVASGALDAKALIGFILAHRQKQFVRIDVPEATGLGPWLETQGLVSAGGGVAMSTKPESIQTGVGVSRFALANQALG